MLFTYRKQVILIKLKKEDGSITIEAALIVPILLMFFLFLTALVKISIAEMALKEAVSETAQTVAHYSFLSLVIEGAIMDGTEGFIDDIAEDQKKNLGNNEIADYFLDKASEGIKNAIPTTGALINDYVAEDAFEKAIVEKYKNKVGNSPFFSPDTISIIDHNFPQEGNLDVKIEVQNELHLVMPFFEKKIQIKKKAVERAWAGS